MAALEVICETVSDARAATIGGADSLELITRLDVGGLTPSLKTVRTIREAVACPMYVIVRPHAQSFVYNDAERAQILAGVEAFVSSGVTGIVFGALTPDNMLDLALMQNVAQAASPLVVTMHRALDHILDPQEALAQVLPYASRVLCSGHPHTAWEGRDTLRQWVKTFGRRAAFVAAGGITLENAALLANYTGVHTVHVGSAARTNDSVDEHKVRALKQALA